VHPTGAENKHTASTARKSISNTDALEKERGEKSGERGGGNREGRYSRGRTPLEKPSPSMVERARQRRLAVSGASFRTAMKKTGIKYTQGPGRRTENITLEGEQALRRSRTSKHRAKMFIRLYQRVRLVPGGHGRGTIKMPSRGKRALTKYAKQQRKVRASELGLLNQQKKEGEGGGRARKPVCWKDRYRIVTRGAKGNAKGEKTQGHLKKSV